MKKLYVLLTAILVFLQACALLENKNTKIEEVVEKFEAGCKGDIATLESILTDSFGWYDNGTLLNTRAEFIKGATDDPFTSEWNFIIKDKSISDKTADVTILLSATTNSFVISIPAGLKLVDSGDIMASKWLVNRMDTDFSTSGAASSTYGFMLKKAYKK